MTSESDLQHLLEKEIPVTKALGFQIKEASSDLVKLILPLLPNRNHKGTAFGGSLYSASAVASYALFLFSLQAQGLDTKEIVIGEGRIRYRYPVTADSILVAKWENAESREHFFKVLKMEQRSKTTLKVEILCKNQIAATFEGEFFARRHSN